jgi:hypothetical protein
MGVTSTLTVLIARAQGLRLAEQELLEGYVGLQ